MADDAAPKPRFEPPPWEREAFERFRAERERAEAEARSVTQPPAGPSEPLATQAAPTATAGRSIEAAEGAAGSGDKPAGVSEAEIESMLVGLRAEEPPAARTNLAIVNTVIGLFVGAGVLLIVEAALLFGRTRAAGAGGMLGATASLLVMLAGVGFIAGAVLLFRKYHM